MDVAACGFQSDSQRRQRLATSAYDVSISSASESDADAVDGEESDASDDNFGVDALPRDRESLEHELARLDEEERRLQRETAADFVLGCKLLQLTRQQRVAKAHAALSRRHSAAEKVFEYAGQKARETYAARCNELQREMNNDIERELRRLQTAKDGVSVTSRRRRAVRDETRGGFSTPAKSAGNGMRRRRTMYTSDGEDGPEDVFLASASLEERAHRVQFQEKKRLERLLGRASVFRPVVKQVTAEEIAEDLEAIRSAVPCNAESLETTKPNRKHKKQPHKKQPKKKKPTRQRPRIVTPRRIPHASAPNLPETPLHKLVKTAAQNRRPRLHYNPRMLQEGQEVELYKRHRPGTATADVDESQDECVMLMSGIITAATETQVYVLTASGRFESFDVRDCFLGSLYVRAALENSSSTNSGSHDRTPSTLE